MRQFGVFLLIPSFFYFLWFLTGNIAIETILQFVSLIIASLLAMFYHRDDKATTRWFVRKRYGVTWYPICWQGWAVSIFIGLSLILITMISDRSSNSMTDTLQTALPFITVIIVIGVWVIYKTGQDVEFFKNNSIDRI